MGILGAERLVHGMRLSDLPRLLAELSRLEAGPPAGRGEALTLDQLLGYASVEDLGLYRSRLYEHSSRPLVQRLPWPRRRRPVTMVAVDSSSRVVETPSHAIIITVASASSTSVLELYDYPEVHRYPVDPGRGPPYIAVVPGGSYSHPLTGSNPRGRVYGRDYSLEAAMDEWRVALENWMLGKVLPGAIREVARGGAVALVDGPLTPLSRAPGDRGLWGELARLRGLAVKGLEDMGVPVLGVVKRVERSRLLSSTPGLRGMVEECAGVADAGDRALIHVLQGSPCTSRSPGRVLVTPRIVVEPRLEGALGKIVEYVVVPPGRWQGSPHRSRVYRLEYTERSLALLRGMGLEPHHVLALDSIARGSLEPLTVKASDRRAKSISKAFRDIVARGLRLHGVPLSYTSEVSMGL